MKRIGNLKLCSNLAKHVIRFFDYLKRFRKMQDFLGNNEVKAFLRLLLQLQKDKNPIM